MNAIALVQPPQMAVSEIERVALAIARGKLFGSNDPDAVLTLCFLAYAEGQHPAVVFRDYHIIKGKPAKKAEAMLRDFITAGGKVEWHTLDDNCADATFSHPGGGTIRIDWTIKRAQQAGINTEMWKKYPRQMLRSRVISEGVRTVYPGATSGLYEENEVRDIVAEQGGDQGQSQTGEVSPEPPAQITDERPAKGWREPDSPFSTPTKLHAAMNRLDHELNGCGDSGMVYGVTALADWKEFVRVAEKHSPHYLRGGDPAPEEFEGLLTKAERLVAEFDTETANTVADIARA